MKRIILQNKVIAVLVVLFFIYSSYLFIELIIKKKSTCYSIEPLKIERNKGFDIAMSTFEKKTGYKINIIQLAGTGVKLANAENEVLARMKQDGIEGSMNIIIFPPYDATSFRIYTPESYRHPYPKSKLKDRNNALDFKRLKFVHPNLTKDTIVIIAMMMDVYISHFASDLDDVYALNEKIDMNFEAYLIEARWSFFLEMLLMNVAILLALSGLVYLFPFLNKEMEVLILFYRKSIEDLNKRNKRANEMRKLEKERSRIAQEREEREQKRMRDKEIRKEQKEKEQEEKWIQKEITKAEEQARQIKEAKNERERREKEVIKKASKLGYEDHPTFLKLLEGEEVDDSELTSFEHEVYRVWHKRAKKEEALDVIPGLMIECEEAYGNLPASEQRSYAKYIRQYRSSIANVKKPCKLRKNLEWFLQKMSKIQ